MSLVNPNLAIVIPTYKRAHLVKELLADLSHQSILPTLCVIVDGAPEENNVVDYLAHQSQAHFEKIIYVPSNHPNAPFQRYLGAQIAKEFSLIIFFDDDVRLFDNSTIQKIIDPFKWNERFVVGVTPSIEFPTRKPAYARKTNHSPGSLTPVGDRILPASSDNYAAVDWLRGGVMAYRTQALLPEIFNEAVFALSHIRCGLGVDDTFLSRQVSKYGELLLANCTSVQHPDLDISRAYPSRGYQLAYARAYSRRFINDHFRITRPPYVFDRFLLLKSYIGNNMLNFFRFLIDPSHHHFSYAWGYLHGSLRGVFRKPTVKNLTPQINWLKDAEIALSRSIELK